MLKYHDIRISLWQSLTKSHPKSPAVPLKSPCWPAESPASKKYTDFEVWSAERIGPATMSNLDSCALDKLLFLDLRIRFPEKFADGDLLDIFPAPSWREIILQAFERIEALYRIINKPT